MNDSSQQRLSSAVASAVTAFQRMADFINKHREQWLCEGEGQWPDKFSLLNRYVRTDCEPPFIFSD